MANRMPDDPDFIADALAQLHAAGWSIGETAFVDVECGGIIHVVIGTNGENQIRAEGETAAEAWCRELGQAAEVGMLARSPRPERGDGPRGE
jgi:hypothetical protein